MSGVLILKSKRSFHGELALVAILGAILLRALVFVCGTIIGKGFLLFLDNRGIHPDQLVARMMGAVMQRGAGLRPPVWINWVLAGAFGLIGLGIWEYIEHRVPARHLSPMEKTCLTDEFGKNKDLLGSLLIFTTTDKNSGVYANDFITVFEDVGIVPQAILSVVTSEDEHDVMIGVRDPKTPSEKAKSFANIFNDKCKIPVHFVKWAHAPNTEAFDLYIGPPK